MPATETLRLRQRLREQRLQWVLLAVVVVCIAIPALASGGYSVYENYQKTVSRESRATAETYADLLASGMELPLWNVSPELGAPLVQSVLVNSDVVRVRVLADTGEVFLYTDRRPADFNASDGLNFTRNIVYGGIAIGRVELTYSLLAARAAAAKETQALALVVLGQLLFSVGGILWLLHRRVVAPLQQLTAAAAKIAGQDLRTEVPLLGRDEFGALAAQFEQMRQALALNFYQLERRVDERTAELRTVNNALRGTLEQLQATQHHLIQSEKLAALGALVAGVAHELNTPIGNGRTVASSMRESCVVIDREAKSGLTRQGFETFMVEMAEGTELVCRNLDKAAELVRSFKQVAMDRTSAQRRAFSLEELLHEVKLTLSPAFKRTPYQVNIEISNDARLDSYPGPLGQVITNLLNNALIHAFDGRDHGEVSITSSARDGGIELVVKDDGRGIPPGDLRRIFDPFFTTKLGEGGNGLGMHIVHNIVTGILGGSIEARSKVGEGATFILWLPLVAPQGAAASPGEEPIKQIESHTV